MKTELAVLFDICDNLHGSSGVAYPLQLKQNIKQTHHKGYSPDLHHVISLYCSSEIQCHLTEKCGCWSGAVLLNPFIEFPTTCFEHHILRLGVWNQ
jgi:hypothetical protein